jgi:hypothetical protein
LDVQALKERLARIKQSAASSSADSNGNSSTPAQ